MKKTLLIVLACIIAIVLFVGTWYSRTYNDLVQLDESVKTQWSQVENQMQRRYDLIPNLVSTVKGYAKHEKDVFVSIAEARSKLAGARNPNEKVTASNGLEGALSRLLMITENYPELKANENFTRLMDELAGAENRLSVERMRYNELVKVYNIKLRTFPTSIIAGSLHFELKEQFKVEEKAKAAPKVDFQ